MLHVKSQIDGSLLIHVGNQTLNEPFILEVVISPNDVTSVTNADDVTTTGNALINLTQTTFSPGDNINYELKFANPGRTRFTYVQNIYRPTSTGPSNTPPNAINDSGYTVNEDAAITGAVSVLSNDTDGNGDQLTAVLENDVTNGTLTLNADGTFDYTPNAGFNGTDSFTYFANDGTVDSTTSATVTITVNPINDAPIANVDTVTTNEDEAVTINVLLNDTDADSDYSLSIASIADETNGVAIINSDNTVTFTPDIGFYGIASFSYRVSDGQLNSESAIVTIIVDGKLRVSITSPQEEDAFEQGTAINITANPTDPDDTITQVEFFANGASLFTVSDEPFSQLWTTPALGEQVITAVATNAKGLIAISDPVIIQVNRVNLAPVVDAGPDETINDVTLVTDNLLLNGSGEELLLSGNIPGWDEVIGSSWTTTSSSSFPLATDGTKLIYPGNVATAELSQDVDVTNLATEIDLGRQIFEFEGFIRSGNETRPDKATVILEYYTEGKAELLAQQIFDPDPITNTWLLLNDSRIAPVGTRCIRLRLLAERNLSNSRNDAYFDGLVLRAVTPTNYTLQGFVSDDDLPENVDLIVAWEQVSGPQPAIFSALDDPAATIALPLPGTYTFRFTGDDSEYQTSDEVSITVDAGDVNSPPVVEAGEDQIVRLPDNSLALSGLVTDDGLPAGEPLTVSWIKVKGPSSVTFSQPQSPNTTAFFDEIGEYTLRLTANDSQFNSFDELTVIVECPSDPGPLDVSVVIDRSGSMGGSKIVNARAGAVAFFNRLVPSVDLGSVVSFNSGGRLDQGMTNDIDALIAATNRIGAGGGTRIGPGINIARDQLLNSGRDEVIDLMIVLGDGDGDGQSEANVAKNLGIRIVTIGVGAGVNDNNLKAIATDPSDYYFVGSSSDLTEVFEDIGGSVCRFINGDPIADPKVITTQEDTPVFIQLSGTDPENQPLTFAVLDLPQNGVITGTVPDLTYTPGEHFSGQDTFTYRVSDGIDFSEPVTVTINVEAVNDAPVTIVDEATTNEDEPVIIDVLFNDSDADSGDSLSIASISDEIDGSATINPDNTITFTPNPDFNGIATFSYIAQDNSSTFSASTAVVIIVDPVNDAPTGTQLTESLDEGDSIIIDLLANATDIDGPSLSIDTFTQPTYGEVIDNNDGTVTYIHNGTENFSDIFEYSVSDSFVSSAASVVNLTINPVNDIPIANDASFIIDEDAVLTNNLIATDSDGDILSFALDAQAVNGNVVVDPDGTFTYNPNADFNGIDSFTFTVADASALSIPTTVTINVNPVNDPPLITSAELTNAAEGSPYIYTVTTSDIDVGDIVTVTVPTLPDWLSFDGVTLTGTPGSVEVGDYPVEIVATDLSGATFVQSFIIAVVANNSPIANTDTATTNEDTAVVVDVLANDTDVDINDILSISSVSDVINGTATINPDNTITFIPDADFSGTATFNYTAKDNNFALSASTAVTITVNSINDVPVANDASFIIVEDTALTNNLTAIDVDGDALSFILDTQAANGTAIVNSDGSFTYTPNVGFEGVDSFIFTVADVSVSSASAVVTITVNAINNPPVIAPVTLPVFIEDTAVTFDLTVTDADNDALTVNIVDPANGTLNLTNTSGNVFSFEYTPNANYFGPEPLSIGFDDSNAGTATFNQLVDVLSVNDVPVLSVTSPTEGTSFLDTDTLTFTASASDTDGSIAQIEFFLNGESFNTLDTAPFTFSQVLTSGNYVLTAVATDDLGLESEVATVNFNVRLQSSGPLTANITTSIDSIEITEPTPIVGTANSANFDSYTLEYRLVGSSSWTAFANSIDPVNDDQLGIFDPTLLRNGIYEVRLSVRETDGTTLIETTTYTVDTQMKVGHFNLAFEDLNVPVSGIPVQLLRTYDSRGALQGDFGTGWDLGMRTVQVYENSVLGEDWEVVITRSQFGIIFYYNIAPTKSHIVTVVLGDDQVEQFEAIITSPENPVLAPPTVSIGFKPINGSVGNLALVGNNSTEVLYNGNQTVAGTPAQIGFLDFVNPLDPINPSRYVYTTPDGTEMEIQEILGLRKLTDRNDNALTITEDGITHTSGKSITFTRDAENRITTITDPNGNQLTYEYDTQGRLSRFYDREGNNPESNLFGLYTEYRYENPNFPNYLTSIIDPRGIEAIASEYDDDGRLVGQTDADGNQIDFVHDIPNKREIITDRLGVQTIHEYDLNGNVVVTRTVDPNNPGGELITQYAYDANDNETLVIDPLGNRTERTYDLTTNNLLSETQRISDGNGGFTEITTTYTYDSFSNPTSIVDSRGNTTAFAYDSRGNLLSQTDAEGNVTTFTYDSAGNLTSMTDAEGNVTDNTYDGSGNMTSTEVRDDQGTVLTSSEYTYDNNGNQLSQTTTRTLYDDAGNAIGTEDLLTQFEYDSENRVTKTTFPPALSGVEGDGTFTEVTYNEFGKEATSTDQLGRTTEMFYDDRGNLVRTLYPDATEESMTYDLENRRLSSTDRLGRTTYFIYDELGRMTDTIHPDDTMPADPTILNSSFLILNSVELADNPRSSTIFDEIGRVATSFDELGNPTLFSYDPQCGCSGRRNTVTNALGQVTNFAYDENGNQLSMTDANGHTTSFVYDDNNRPTRTTFHDGTFTEIVYDSLNRRVAEIDQEGKVKEFAYDGLGRLVQVTEFLAYTAPGEPDRSDPAKVLETRYTYDEVGNLIAQTDAESHTTRYQYDSLGRRIKRILPEGEVETMTYYDNGNLATRTDFNGYTTTYLYDSLDRLVEKQADPTHPSVVNNTGPAFIVYTYDAAGQRTSAATLDITRTVLHQNAWTYDERGRVLSVSNAQGTLTYTYDAANNLTSVQSDNANGVDLNYSYDALNRLSTVLDSGASVPPAEHTYSYDDVGNLQTLTYQNGVRHEWTYNSLNRLTDLTIRNSSLSILNSYAYTLRASGHRSRVTEASGRRVDYTYDDLYRLTDESISSDPVGLNGDVMFSYDKVGNRLTRVSTLSLVEGQNFTYDANDRLDSDTYDANGNTLESIAEELGGYTDEYDFENRLVKRTYLTGKTITIAYDADGNRIQKTIQTSPLTLPTSYFYLVDRNNLTGYAQVVEELRDDGTGSLEVFRTYTYGLDLIAQHQLHPPEAPTEWKTSYYLYDGLGTVRALADENGTITDTYTYSAFGEILSEIPNSSLLTPNLYKFTGEQYDPDLEMYFLRARYMDPSKGRFHSMDMFEGRNLDPITLHKYLYANANPVMFIDPSGYLSFVELMHAIGIQKILRSASATRKLHQARRTMSKLCRIVAKPANGLIKGYKALTKQLRKINSNSKLGVAAHHVIQNAMLITNTKYTRNIGLAIPLLGKYGQRLTPHWIANQAQLHRRLNKDIRATAFLALRGAGCRNADATSIIDSVEAAYEAIGIAVGIGAIL